MNNLDETWLNELKNKGLILSEKQVEQFQRYYELLIEWNERVNLTAITEKVQVYYKHFYDSLTLSFYISMNERWKIADIGSGAGFPGIPLAIVFPNVEVTIIDSLNKRIRFLELLVQELGCNNVRCIHGRAEEIGQNADYREQFDIVTARAVARLQILNEYCLPLVKVGGRFAAMKAADADVEVQEAKRSLQILGGRIHQTYKFELPFEQASREIIVIDKMQPTPKKYPRKPGQPAKQPL